VGQGVSLEEREDVGLEADDGELVGADHEERVLDGESVLACDAGDVPALLPGDERLSLIIITSPNQIVIGRIPASDADTCGPFMPARSWCWTWSISIPGIMIWLASACELCIAAAP
jgi:hypothetical protein